MKVKAMVKKAGPYAYLVPALAVFAVFLFYPFFKTIYLSLYKTNKMGQARLFVGAGNYKDLLTSSSFLNSLVVTGVFVAIVVSVSMLLGLFTALLCNKTFPGIRSSAQPMRFLWRSLQFGSHDLQNYASPVDRHCKQADGT